MGAVGVGELPPLMVPFDEGEGTPEIVPTAAVVVMVAVVVTAAAELSVVAGAALVPGMERLTPAEAQSWTANAAASVETNC